MKEPVRSVASFGNRLRTAIARRFLVRIKRASHRMPVQLDAPVAGRILVIAPHMDDEAIACALECGEAGVHVAISSRAQLPSGFSLARIPNGVSGLGLVRALLPRRSAALSIEQAADLVVATVSLSPPGVQRIGAA